MQKQQTEKRAFPSPGYTRKLVTTMTSSSIDKIMTHWAEILEDPTQAKIVGSDIQFDLPVANYTKAHLGEAVKRLTESGWSKVDIVMGCVRVTC